jgi:hypothetical protein
VGEIFDTRRKFYDRRFGQRRAEDRRATEEPTGFPDRRGSDGRRSGSRREEHPLAEDYEAAVAVAKAAIKDHGMDSAEFIAAQKLASEIHRRMHEDESEG